MRVLRVPRVPVVVVTVVVLDEADVVGGVVAPGVYVRCECDCVDRLVVVVSTVGEGGAQAAEGEANELTSVPKRKDTG